jgi:FAD/FMN-containing dehydrogenase
LQFHVNTEIGNLSAGSAACAGTKDGSMPGEYGQVGSYVTGLKMVLPSGDLLEVTENQPELMQKVRSSYGTFGIVYEVTFRVRPLTRLSVHHKTFHLKDLIASLPDLKALGYSMMYYIFPFDDQITVEFRKYNPQATGDPDRKVWELRNYFWATVAPKFSHDTEQNVAVPSVRYALIDRFSAIQRFNLENLVKSDNTVPTDQMIRYPAVSNDSRYTFSLSAFPEETYPVVLTDYFQFCKDYYQQKGYRSNMLSVGYRIAQDQQSLLSYSYDGPVITVDPVSTGNPGWNDFLAAYNQFCSDHGGIPLLNQTFGLTPAMVQKAFGDRLKVFEATRKTYDPTGRLLSPYFQTLLGS